MRSATLSLLAALVPLTANAENGLDCLFTQLCIADTCNELDAAAMRVRFVGIGDDHEPAALILADSRLVSGARAAEGQNLSLFGDLAKGTQVMVQRIGAWVNFDQNPRREIVVDLGYATRLTVGPGGMDNAVLTKEGGGLTAFFGTSRAVGICEPEGF